MTLKELLQVHKPTLFYTVEIKTIRDGKKIHLDYCDNLDSPWEEYLIEYLPYEVESFAIEQKAAGDIYLEIVIKYEQLDTENIYIITDCQSISTNTRVFNNMFMETAEQSVSDEEMTN